MIFVLSGIRSVGAGIQSLAVNALLSQIVPGNRLLRANSINGTLQSFIMIAARVTAGALLSYSHLESILLTDAVTAAIAIELPLTLSVPPLERAPAPQRSYLADLQAGMRYSAGSRVVSMLFMLFALVWFLVVPAAFLSPLLVAHSYGEEVRKLTANQVTFFGGSILARIIVTAWSGFKGKCRTIGMTCIAWAVLFAALGLARDFSLYLAPMVLSGIRCHS